MIDKIISKELDIIKEQKQFDLKNYLEKRLAQYAENNNNDFDNLKTYFANNTDIVQPKTAQDEEEAYMKLLHDFLTDAGY